MNDWQQDFDWEDLLDAIQKGQCVLVIGPDLVDYDNNHSLFQQLCEALQKDQNQAKNVNWSAPFVFEHEELLQLEKGSSIGRINKFLGAFYQSRTEFDTPFQKIAQLPFHLIISLLPDQRLLHVFEKEKRNPKFGYFPLDEHWKEVDKPTEKQPLIYNILGLIKDEIGSTVITFNTLFLYLKRILSDKALPENLEPALKNSTYFLFLGVRFEKWYMQVLLKVFNSYEHPNLKENPLRQFSLLHLNQFKDGRGFIAQRLELSPLHVTPMDFLDELHRRCGEAGMLQQAPKSYEKQVFISYSHQDKADIERIKGALEKANIKVIIDEESMPVGERISRFMERVKTVDKVVLILSQHSLRSRYVGKEIMLAAEHHTPVIACHTDQEIWSLDYVGKTQAYIDQNLQAIEQERIARKQKDIGDKVEDLRADEELWIDLKVNLGKMVGNLKQEKSLSIQAADLEKNIAKLIKNILT